MSTNLPLYTKTSVACSRLITNNYSTSFSMGIRCFDKRFRDPIYALYGFVRVADEIVDTFHDYNRVGLIEKFKSDTFDSIQDGISTNPVLQAFQLVVNKYNIEHELIDAFLKSMEMDLELETCCDETYEEYIYGSAEVIGLMCLRIFCEGDDSRYQSLRPAARKLGAAFQKVNFLRDMQSDFVDRGRVYFPRVNFVHFCAEQKRAIEDDIQEDFEEALQGIKGLPSGSKLGVYIAYIYYQSLLKKIKSSSISRIKTERVRVNDTHKLFLLIKGALKYRINDI